TAHADRIVLVAGRESRGYPCYEVNVELGKKLGRDLIELPGGHVGYVSQPAEFAREFVQALARTGHGPKARCFPLHAPRNRVRSCDVQQRRHYYFGGFCLPPKR